MLDVFREPSEEPCSGRPVSKVERGPGEAREVGEARGAGRGWGCTVTASLVCAPEWTAQGSHRGDGVTRYGDRQVQAPRSGRIQGVFPGGGVGRGWGVGRAC